MACISNTFRFCGESEIPPLVNDPGSCDCPIFAGAATGTVPAATGADAGKVLSGAGTWITVAGGAAETPLTVTDSSSIDFTSGGTAGHALTGVVKLSAAAGNALAANADGLFVATPAAGAAVPIFAGSATGTVPAATAADAGKVLSSNGSWISVSAAADTNSKIPDAPAKNSLLLSTGIGDPHTTASGGGGNSDWLSPGVEGQSLTVNAAGDVIWQERQKLLPQTLPAAGLQLFASTGAASPTDAGDTGVWLAPGAAGTVLSSAGTWVPLPAAETPLTVTDSSTVDLTASGTAGHNVTAVVKLSATAGNYLTINPDGLFAPTPVAGAAVPVFAGTATGTVPAATAADAGKVLGANGSWVSVAAAADTNSKIPDAPNVGALLISNGAGDPHTTASLGGGKSEWLAKGTVGQSLSIDPVTGNPYWRDKQDTLPKTAPGTGLQIFGAVQDPANPTDPASSGVWLAPGAAGTVLSSNGTWVPLPAAETPLTVTDSSTVDLTSSGTAGHNVTAVVKLSATAGNYLTINPDGLFAPTPVAGAAVPVFAGSATGTVPAATAADAGKVLGANGSWVSVAAAADTNWKLPDSPADGSLLLSTGVGSPETVASGAAGKSAWLAKGTVGQSLSIDPVTGNPYWRDKQDTLPKTSPTAGLQIFGAIGSTSPTDPASSGTWLAPGAAGTVLSSAGTWVPLPAAETPLTVTDSSTVDLTSSGTAGHTVTAVVKLSATAGNYLTINPDGLFAPTPVPGAAVPIFAGSATGTVPAATAADAAKVLSGAGTWVTVAAGAAETPLTVTDSSTVDLTSSGTAGHNVTAVVKVSATAGNVLAVNADGLFVPAAAAGVDTNWKLPNSPADGALLLSTGVGSPETVASGAAGKSTWLTKGTVGQSLSIDPVTGNPYWRNKQDTLPQTSPTAGLQLFAAIGSSSPTDPASSGVWLAPGAAGTVLSSAGTWVALPAAETPLTVTDSSTVDLTSSGTAGHNVTAVVKLSATAGNSLVINADGLFVPTPTAGAAVPVFAGSATGTVPAATPADAGKVLSGAGTWITPTSSGVETPLTVTDSSTIDLTSSGTAGHTLTAVVKRSATAGNSLVINADGLFVPTPVAVPVFAGSATGTVPTATPADAGKVLSGAGTWITVAAGAAETPLTVTDSSTVDLTSSGTAGHTVTAVVKVSATAGNALAVNADGLFVPAAAAGVDTNWKLPEPINEKQILISNGAGVPETTASGGGGKSLWENENQFLIRNLDGIATDSAVTTFVGAPSVPYQSEPGAILAYQNSTLRVPQIFKRQRYSNAFAQFNLPQATATEVRNTNVLLAPGTRHNLLGLQTAFNTSGYSKGTTPITFTDTDINIPVAGVWQITMAATIGMTMNAASLLITPGTGAVMTAAAARLYHEKSYYFPCLSFVVNDSVVPAYEVRGTQTPILLQTDPFYYSTHDVSVITTATVYFNNPGVIIPRIHWFSGFQMGSAKIAMTASRSTSMFCSIVQIQDGYDYYGTF
jgi:hypothetical protein